jgi:hypothetical protein
VKSFEFLATNDGFSGLYPDVPEGNDQVTRRDHFQYGPNEKDDVWMSKQGIPEGRSRTMRTDDRVALA